jgi:pimeloyl-ACP methyl ester carboxylesterase
MRPKTRYAKSGEVHVAYQVIGDGPLDLIFVPGFVSNVEHWWEMPVMSGFLRRLASFSRLILFDKRGTGCSDPVRDVPTLEERMDDVRAVMDAAGSGRAALFGVSEGGPMSLLFAATYPERTSALVIYGSSPRFTYAPDAEWGWKPNQVSAVLETIERDWGEGPLLQAFVPSGAGDEATRQAWAAFLHAGGSPAMALGMMRSSMEMDVRNVLPAIRVPTLVLHVTAERCVSVRAARYMAGQIPGARLVELPGEDHFFPLSRDTEALGQEIEHFLTGTRSPVEADRVLATVMFADIVGSTERASELGDRRWRDVLERYYTTARRELAHFRGREIDTAGDGFFASFDGPARGIRCAASVRDAVRSLGIDVRAGLHTGECELIGEKVGGIAVHIGARVAAAAAAGEIIVSSTVKDLVVGSGIHFADRGSHVLKGVPGEWHLFAVESAARS